MAKLGESWIDTGVEKPSATSVAAKLAFHLINTVAVSCSLVELAWGVVSKLYYDEIINVDYVTEAMVTLSDAMSTGYDVTAHIRRISPVFMIVCGLTITATTVFGITALWMQQRKQNKWSKSHRRYRYTFLVIVWAQIFAYCIVISLCMGGKSSLIFYVSTTMATITSLRHNADNITVETMDFYQNMFGCCGSRNISDWTRLHKVPDSCCTRPSLGCANAYDTSTTDDDVIAGRDQASYVIITDPNSGIHRSGCDEIITSYAYTTTTIACLHIVLLLFLHVTWHLRHSDVIRRRGNEAATLRPSVAFARETRSDQVVSKPLHLTVWERPGKEKAKQRHLEAWERPEPKPREGADVSTSKGELFPISESKTSITQFADWGSIHKTAQEARMEWAARQASSDVTIDRDDLSVSSVDSVVW